MKEDNLTPLFCYNIIVGRGEEWETVSERRKLLGDGKEDTEKKLGFMPEDIERKTKIRYRLIGQLTKTESEFGQGITIGRISLLQEGNTSG